MAYSVGFYIVCTQLAAISLAVLNPPVATAIIHSKEELKAARVAARQAKIASEAFINKAAKEQSESEQARLLSSDIR